jgi:serine/threonine-protein kinase RsbW
MKPLPQCSFDSQKLLPKFEIIFSASLDAVTPVIDRIMGLVREMNCAAGKEFEIETSLREALVNAVVHGCKRDPGKKIQCCVACEDTRGLLIVVRDPGPGFDPAALPSPIIGQNLFASHGRGIYMINQLMDEVRFQHGGTEIHMRKR